MFFFQEFKIKNYLVLSELFNEIKRLASTAWSAIEGFCKIFIKNNGLYKAARLL